MDFAYFYSAKRGEKFFELSNHLGNVLSVVSDRKLPVENGWVRKYGASLQKQTSGQEIEEIIKSDFQLLVSDPGSYFANKLTDADPILGSLIRTMTTAETIQKVGEGDPEAIATITLAVVMTRTLQASAQKNIPPKSGTEPTSGINRGAAKGVDDLVGFRKDHILNRHQAGAGKPGKTEFPAEWSDQRILDEVNKIANDPKAPGGVGKWDSPYKTGTVDGIEIRVDFYPSTHPSHAGKVSTAYPTNTTPNATN